MKKIFVIATALLMCCMVMGCGVKAKLDGTWKSSNTIENSYDYFKAVAKTDITLNINKDGTYSQSAVTNVTYTLDMDAEEVLPEPEKYTVKESGNWYYHDSDKVILKTTNSSVQEGDEDPEVDNKVSYMSAELVLVDDILFVDRGGQIFEFTKAE
jgi:hypothetical protein